ncbi:hypothetical protein [Demequina soli]|uniref:hypothetical protein n=1 Tax=Demequina soli TaxID=1638987 RepID=UPI00078116AA|nr:hypothetical protein [Demequina soli]
MADIDGRWHIEAMTPMGKQTSVLDLAVSGSSATGTLAGPDGTSSEILDAKVDGSRVEFGIQTTTPMAMKINLSLEFEGDAVTGKVKAGIFPPARAAGWRVAG